MRFLKLRMIWAIIRDRTVVYNADLSPEGLMILTDKACVFNNRFNSFGIINNDGIQLIGG